MAIQITIIGLGQAGVSIGLALAAHKEQLHRTGHDPDLNRARQAEKLGAVDAVHINLPAAVEKANLVILAQPLDQIRATLEVIGPVLPPGAVVVDLTPVKQSVMEWAEQLLPAGRYYIGLAPVRNPRYLDTPEIDANTGYADFFQHSLIAVVTPPGVPAQANRLAMDLISLLGADHLFVDPYELDGLTTGTHILPGMLASALVHTTMGQPGWREARKLADQAYASVSRPASQAGSAAELAEMALNAPENTLRHLDGMLSALQKLRTLVASKDALALQDYFEQAQTSRSQWWQERGAGNWKEADEVRPEIPPTRQGLGQLLGFGKAKEKKPRQ
ncbi:MAG: prephenate dehydrogenase [Anaerolineales bacterium]|jgi:prephenate dehydrogenase|nr:prephenate dehydrogenase [Anaerolineales bacterium]